MKLYCIVAAVLLCASSLAQARSEVLEFGYEATTADVTLPSSETGELTLQGCATCKVVRLRANAATRYEIAGQRVTLAEMARYLASNKKASLVVMQRKASSELSRLVVITR